MIVVALTCLNSLEEVKNLETASMKLDPTRLQVLVKNSAVKPSGPIALFLGREYIANMISS